MIKSQALSAMKDQTDMQMQQIYEQMQLLANQASKIKKRAEVSMDIYDAEMRFKPVVNKFYYLYEKANNAKVLSMIAPSEWGKSLPFEKFVSKVRLLADHTWQIIEQE
jgi:hypothetical protein